MGNIWNVLKSSLAIVLGFSGIEFNLIYIKRFHAPQNIFYIFYLHYLFISDNVLKSRRKFEMTVI